MISDGKTRMLDKAGQISSPVAVILDRDGVINDNAGRYVCSPSEFRPLDGSLEAIGELCRAGFRLAIATNQSAIARGLLTEECLEEIHRKLKVQAAEHGGFFEYIVHCPHGPWDACSCRKPQPGMLFDLCDRLGCEPGQSLFVGDSDSDVEAAQHANMPVARVLTGNGSKSLLTDTEPQVPRFSDLAELVRNLLGEQHGEHEK